MRSSKSRSRNKSNRQRTLVNVVNRVFDSSGPEGKVRGTPQQIIDKYLTLARDAQLSNDRVAEQSFFQHAEHYTRMLGEAQREMAERQQFQPNRNDGDDGRDGQNTGQGNGQNAGHNPSQNGHQGRDQAQRDDNRREGGHRDQNRDSNRDGGGREGGREWRPRENSTRDGTDRQGGQGGRSHDGRDPGMRGQPSQHEVRSDRDLPQAVADDAPSVVPSRPDDSGPAMTGLPDVVSLSEDQPAGPVDTPEAGPGAPRTRAPRAPRGDKPAVARTPRRRKAPDDTPADEAADAPASANGND